MKSLNLAPLILLLAACLAPSVSASPVNWILEAEQPIAPFSADGFARVQFAIPLGAEILAVETVGKALRLHYSADVDAPMVWRVIELTAGTTPQTIPTERYIDLLRIGELRVHAWDMGQFSEPVPSARGRQ